VAYLIYIKNTTYFLRDIKDSIEVGAEAKANNVYVFKNVRDTFDKYWTCEQANKAPRYIKKEDVNVYVISLKALLQFFVGIDPSIEDVEDKLAHDLSCLLKIFHNKRDDTD
jgi:hypothetical protein